MYQIFPDRFCKSGDLPIGKGKILHRDWGGLPSFRPNEYGKVLNNDFFGGNLNGITEKLDYLASLGVTVLYCNPIFEAYSNHRYDTGDYMKIDPLLGTEQDLDRLVRRSQETRHSDCLGCRAQSYRSDSRYFNKYGHYDSLGAYQSKDSPYSDWYHFRTFPDSYDSWWGIDTLPAVNEQSPSYQEFVFGETAFFVTGLHMELAAIVLTLLTSFPISFWRNCVLRSRTAIRRPSSSARSGKMHPIRSLTASVGNICREKNWTAS